MNWELVGEAVKLICAGYISYVFITMMLDIEKLKNRQDYMDEKVLRLKKKLKSKSGKK